jgi:hypothetical protein
MSGTISESIHVFGEFRISSALARRVNRAVSEILQENLLKDLSHVDEDCALCRGKEVDRDASQPDRPGRIWVA